MDSLIRLIMGVLAVATLCSCKAELYARVSERDANEILATLYASGIDAGKSSRDEKTWSVQVDEHDLGAVKIRALFDKRSNGSGSAGASSANIANFKTRHRKSFD